MQKTASLGFSILTRRTIAKNTECESFLICRHSFLGHETNSLFRCLQTQVIKKIEPTIQELDSDDFYGNYDSLKLVDDIDRKKAKKRLQNLFEWTPKDTEKITKQNPGLLDLTEENVNENINYFEQIGLKMTVVKDHPWLLLFKTKAISTRLPYFKVLGLKDINKIAPLMSFPINRLRQASWAAKVDNPNIPGGNRVNYLSKRLKSNPVDVWKTALKHQFLLTLPFNRLTANLSLLLQYGITPRNIMNDVWVFRYQPKTVELRLKLAKEAGMQILKPWIVRCPNIVLENTLQRSVDSRTALGTHTSVTEYLSQRLECNVDDIVALTKRYPPLLKVHVLKLKEVLDFLYEEGFTSGQVCQVPRVMCHSLETLQERLNQIRDLGHNPLSLIVLCRSKRQYLDYLNKLTSYQKQSYLGQQLS